MKDMRQISRLAMIKIIYYALEMVKIEDSGLLSGYIYIDVNETKQNLYIKLISTINNL